MFYANMKPSFENYGKKAAAYHDRINYLSAEEGTQGIYSMLLDGTDVRLEFEAEDIRSLTDTPSISPYTFPFSPEYTVVVAPPGLRLQAKP